jgi:hypothetical protein
VVWPWLSLVPLAGQVPLDATDLLMEVRIEGGPSGVVQALLSGSTVLVDAQGLLELAGVAVDEVADGASISATLYPEGLTLWVDTRLGLLDRDGRQVQFLSDQAAWSEGRLFLDVALLGALLDVDLSASVTQQLVAVRRGENLPAVREAARRRRARALGRAAGRDAPLPPVSAETGTHFGGAVVDWSLSLGTFSTSNLGGFSSSLRSGRVGVGMNVLGGSGVVAYNHFGGTGSYSGIDNFEWRWTRAWPQNGWVRQVQLGRVQGTGPLRRMLRGGVITNVPFVRPAAFLAEQLTGNLPPGWEVELYRGPTLMEAVTPAPGGRYAFSVPLDYGFNPYRVVAYGPSGEVRSFDRSFDVFRGRLPTGQFEYSLSGGECDPSPCEAATNVDLRWGVSRILTLEGGATALWHDTIPDRQVAYGGAIIQPTRSLSLSGNWVSDIQAGGQIRFAPSSSFRAGIGYTRIRGAPSDPLRTAAIDQGVTTAFLFYRPGILRGRTSINVSGSHSESDLLDRTDVSALFRGQIRRVRLDLGGRRLVRSSPSGTDDPVYFGLLRTVFQMGHQFGVLEGSLLRAGLSVETQGRLDEAFAGISQPLGRNWQLRVEGSWQQTLGSSLRVDLRANLDGLRFSSRNQVYGDGAQGLQTLQGSVLAGGVGGVSVSDGRSLGRSGLSGYAFQDLDGDEVRDPNEPIIRGVRIRTTGRTIRTGADGAYEVWDLVPFETMVIDVDPASGPGAQWTPTWTRFVLRPDPNQFTMLDIPFVRTVEVMGEVRLEPSGRRLAGLDVILLDEAGEEAYRATTFTDGGFYFMGVRPGRYRAVVAPDGLAELGLWAEGSTLDVRPTAEGVVEDLILRIGPEELMNPAGRTDRGGGRGSGPEAAESIT